MIIAAVQLKTGRANNKNYMQQAIYHGSYNSLHYV